MKFLRGLEFLVEPLVIENLGHPVNIGLAFLEQADVTINLRAQMMCFPTFQVKLTKSVGRDYDFGVDEIDAWTAEQMRTAKPGEVIQYIRPLPRSWRRPTQVWTSSSGTDWQPVEVGETKDGWPAITADWTNR